MLVCAWPFVLVLSDVVLVEMVLLDRWVVLAPLLLGPLVPEMLALLL